MDSIFSEGGPHNIKRIGPDQYEIRVSIPTDADGYMGRECPNETCSPGYFKVRNGTGITDGQITAFCPYCRLESDPSDFHTEAQLTYAKELMLREAEDGISKLLKKSLGIGPSGKKKIGGDLLSIEMSFKQSPLWPVVRPVEEELRRDIFCPHCKLEHAVFGLATWCPDCGTDIFLIHVEQEYSVVRKILNAIDSRRAELGARVAAQDIENALEDTVSIFEAVLKAITRNHLIKQGISNDEIHNTFKKIRTSYQSLTTAEETFRKYIGLDVFADIDSTEIEEVKGIFEKRHPITHNLGIIDRKYLERARTGDLEGEEVRVSVPEVEKAIDFCLNVLREAYSRT